MGETPHHPVIGALLCGKPDRLVLRGYSRGEYLPDHQKPRPLAAAGLPACWPKNAVPSLATLV